jgi:hypothetical protein
MTSYGENNKPDSKSQVILLAVATAAAAVGALSVLSTVQTVNA